MKTLKSELTQSASERQQQVEQLLTSLDQLSGKLMTLLQLVEQSELPIIKSTTLLHKVETTTTAIESNLSSILAEIKNLSPQALKTATEEYRGVLKAIQEQISSIDISNLKTLSVSIQSLQTEIDKKISSISIDQKSIQAQIQAQVQQAIANQSELIETEIQSLLNSQKAKHMTWASTALGLLILLTSFYISYQSSTNLKMIKAQKEMIQQNAKTITSQLSYLNNQQGR